ncbi:hypothetical protein ACFTSF_07010 [Kribbella sp. NPDC056951]|uniref:hypothetical protein n=1 Tax=Kribbella sp. NPDC056951 TaxID=3345978 RepID=UPI003645D8DA
MPEHAVIIHISLNGRGSTGRKARAEIWALEGQLEAALPPECGEFDGDEFGAEEVVLYLYGPDADALFSTIENLLRASSLRPMHAVLRYGEASDALAVERRVDL